MQQIPSEATEDMLMEQVKLVQDMAKAVVRMLAIWGPLESLYPGRKDPKCKELNKILRERDRPLAPVQVEIP